MDNLLSFGSEQGVMLCDGSDIFERKGLAKAGLLRYDF
jgi:hypothetical protein